MFIDIIKTSQISAIQLKSFCELSKVTKPLINRSVFIALFCFHKIRCFQQTDPIIVQGSCSPCMPSIHHMMLMTEKHHTTPYNRTLYRFVYSFMLLCFVCLIIIGSELCATRKWWSWCVPSKKRRCRRWQIACFTRTGVKAIITLCIMAKNVSNEHTGRVLVHQTFVVYMDIYETSRLCAINFSFVVGRFGIFSANIATKTHTFLQVELYVVGI